MGQDVFTIQLSKLAQAEILGTEAFLTGKKRIPAQDPELIKLLDDVNNHDDAVVLLKAWLKNWDLSNLSTCNTN
jgi:hypothetical protein